MTNRIRRLIAGITLATTAVTGGFVAVHHLAVPAAADTTWGSPGTEEDTTWGTPPADGPKPTPTPTGPTAAPNDTTWG